MYGCLDLQGVQVWTAPHRSVNYKLRNKTNMYDSLKEASDEAGPWPLDDFSKQMPASVEVFSESRRAVFSNSIRFLIATHINPPIICFSHHLWPCSVLFFSAEVRNVLFSCSSFTSNIIRLLETTFLTTRSFSNGSPESKT